jgi:uncharacterized membrane protein YphA (DoxX/SURF4 family)
MQWLVSTFPKGAPGCGLVLLRVAAALSLLTNASGHLVLAAHISLPGLALIVLSMALVVGFLTPAAAVLGAAIQSATLVANPEAASALMLQSPLICIALALLGPGSYSVDARLFGSRVVVLHSSDRAD